MLITIKKSAHADEVHKIHKLLEILGLCHLVCRNNSQTIIGLEANPSEEVTRELNKMNAVEKVAFIATPYKLASLSSKPDKTVIRLRGVEIGSNRVILMAGPCAIESLEQLSGIAKELSRVGVSVLRGSAYKPRTSP